MGDETLMRAGLRFAITVLLLASALVSTSALSQTVNDRKLSVSGQTGSTPSGAPLTLTLQDALQRAKANSPQFQAALTDLGLAREDRVQRRAAMLPSVN